MSAVDLPPGIGLLGTPLGTFRAPRGARALSTVALAATIALGALAWWFVSKHHYTRHTSTQ
ncbi:MAG TPA: hypothetical protein VLX92_07030, partial [Kofleriaceae bacterium]|nr:hypothetical protein [Kofleriaceae bacterium]